MNARGVVLAVPFLLVAALPLAAQRPARLSGTVRDSAGGAIANAEVLLLARDSILRIARAGARGEFAIDSVVPGRYTAWFRQPGFTSVTYVWDAIAGLTTEVRPILPQRRLAANLAPAVITAQSGYGPDGGAWANFDKRLRWKGGGSIILGPDEMARFGGKFLSDVRLETGISGREDFRSRRLAPTSLGGLGRVGRLGRFATEGDACILFNGRTFTTRPLASISARDVEMLEIYPSKKDVTNTVSDKMLGWCAPGPTGDHPTYYVIWEKGGKR